MVFKSVDGHLTTIFSKTQEISSGFNLATNEVDLFISKFNKMNSKQDFGENWSKFIDDVSSKNANVADMFKNLAKQGATATASVQDFYTAILNGNTSGFMNVKSVIETFNSVDPSHQQDFANAVGTTNANLGKYLSTVQVGSATMQGYGKQLVATTAQTIVLQAKTMALNAAISLGITALVSLAVYGVSKLIGISKEISEGIANANDAYSKTSDSIKSIEEYKTKITELKNALADETTSEEDAYNARKQLLEIQDDLVTKYGLQKDSIDLVNGSLREEIELLDEVSRKKSSDFLRENKESIDNAKKKVEKEKSFSVSFTKSGRYELSDFQDYLLSQGIMSQHTDRAGITSLDSDFTGTTDEAIEHYTKLFECIQKYKNDHIDVLSQSQEGLDYVDSMLTGISNKINKINNEDYQNAKQLYDSATQSELQSNDNYRNIYKATIDARQDYQEAIAQGNENAIYKNLDAMEKAKAEFQKAAEDGKIADLGVSEWFTDFYKDFETESGKYQFKVDITANSDGLKNSVQEALKYFGNNTPTKLDILNLEFKGSEKAQTAFQSLNSVAEQYGMTIEDLISILEDLEIIKIDEKDVDVTGEIVSKVKSDLAKIQTEIEDTFKNTNIFDKTIESINNGGSVDFDTMMSMVEIDSSLADKFTKTADGYNIAVGTLTNARQKYINSTQEQLQADIALAKQTAITAEQNIKDLEAKRDALLNYGINSRSDVELLNKYNAAIESEKEHLQDLNDVASKSALYLNELASSALGTSSYFEKSQNAISGMEEKTTLLKKAMTEMRDTGSISADTYSELAAKGADYVNCLEIQNGKLVLNTEKLKDLDIAALKTAITTNELAMAQINASMAGHEWSEALTEEYNSIELATAALRDKLNEYNNTKPDDKSDSSSGSTKDDKPQSIIDFETELARRQHEIKMGRMEEDEAYFDWLEKAYREAYKGLTGYQDDIYKYEEMVYDGRQKLAEDFYNEQKKYHENRVEELEDTISKIENDKITNLVTQEDIGNLKQFNEEMQKTYGLGNVDLTKRPKVDSKIMRKAGYDVEDGETATVFSSTQFLWQGDEKNGKYVAVHYTPILPDGTVLDEDTLTKYLYDKLESSEDILKADADNLGIVLKVDTDLNISDKDIQSLDAGTPTKHIQEVIKATDDWDIKLHDVQETWLNMTESFQQKSKNFTPAEKFDTIRTVYSDLIAENERRINEIMQSGIEGHEDEVKELERQIEEYADKLQDVFKDEIDYEIKYIEITRDKYNDFIDKRIDRYEDEKKALEDKYDSEIKSIDDTIDALKDKNDEAKTALDLAKAKQELENAKQRTRMVYGSDGSVSYRQDDEAIAEAQQKVNDLEQEQIINGFEKLKESLEEQKQAEVDKYDSMINNLNEQKDKQSDYYDSLLEILNAYLNPKANENLDTVFERILGDTDKVKTEDGTTVVNGTVIDTGSVDSGNIQADKVNEQINKANSIDLVGILKSMGIAEDIAKNITYDDLARLFGFSNVSTNSMVINQPDVNKLVSQPQTNGTNANLQPNTFNIGDIVINSPVGDSNDLAKELRLNLQNAFEKQMYSNLK